MWTPNRIQQIQAAFAGGGRRGALAAFRRCGRHKSLQRSDATVQDQPGADRHCGYAYRRSISAELLGGSRLPSPLSRGFVGPHPDADAIMTPARRRTPTGWPVCPACFHGASYLRRGRCRSAGSQIDERGQLGWSSRRPASQTRDQSPRPINLHLSAT